MNDSLNSMLQETMEKMDPGSLARTLANTAKRTASISEQSASLSPGAKRPKHLQDVTYPDQSEKKSADAESGPSVNEYTGWTVPCQNYIIPAINLSSSSLTPQQFFEDYIKIRRPVILQGTLPDVNQFHKWTNEYLREIAGHHNVMVERRSSEKHTYGRGNEIPLKFSEFVDLVEKEDSKHYLTTQDVEANEDGRPDLMAPFMKSLQQEDFPLVPDIVRTLIPQNVNLWMGNSKDGSSSGLHHDFHDNLYFVLRGRKLIQLYSPKDAEKMYTRGKIAKVHPNGRINYEGEITTAYGADLKSDAAAKAARAKEVAEKRLDEAEIAVKEGKEGAQKELEKAEEMLESAMDALIDVEMDDDEGDEEEDGDDDEEDVFGQDKDEDEKAGGLFGNKPPADGDDEGDEDGDDNEGDEEDVVGTGEGEDEDEKDETDTKSGRRLVDKTVKNPNNFSTVKRHLDGDKDIRAQYPDMLKSYAAFCELSEGDILYMPASWFHEVVSLGNEDREHVHGNSHLALNYWFHPPDALDNFEKPYSTDFWPNDFKQRFED